MYIAQKMIYFKVGWVGFVRFREFNKDKVASCSVGPKDRHSPCQQNFLPKKADELLFFSLKKIKLGLSKNLHICEPSNDWANTEKMLQ